MATSPDIEDFCDPRELAMKILHGKDKVREVLVRERPPEEELFQEGWREEVREIDTEEKEWYDQSNAQNLLAFLDFLAEITAKNQLRDFLEDIDSIMEDY